MDKSFSVMVGGDRDYRDRWEATFGKKKEPVLHTTAPNACPEQECFSCDRVDAGPFYCGYCLRQEMKRAADEARATPNASVAETLGDTRVCPQCGVNVQEHALTTVDGVLLVHCPPFMHRMPATPTPSAVPPMNRCTYETDRLGQCLRLACHTGAHDYELSDANIGRSGAYRATPSSSTASSRCR